jgi:hypothetical protein
MELATVKAALPRCPKIGNWQAMQITRERNDFSTRIEHDASNLGFACPIGQNLEATNVLSLRGGAGLDLDTDQVSG